ncbi:hypothetical protein [Kitasatospora sp. NPDC056531]|uniref:hypothetical protein n=1 Tax=Kitasatospora sp. NPDC056531 TaxID=3345856 RepID=UPI0036D04427
METATTTVEQHARTGTSVVPAKGAAKAAFEASLRRQGARTHDLRLWPTVYPPTGHEGYPPVALVLTPGRKRTRPGAKPLTPEQQAAKAERDHRRLLRRLEAVEDGSAAYWSPRPYPFAGVTAGNYHLALPVVATMLQLLDAHGATARGGGASAAAAGIP